MIFARPTFAILATFLMTAALSSRADDKPPATDPLSSILIQGEDWQVAAENLSFSDGCSADAEGNIYFSDLKSKPPAVYKITPAGKQTKIADAGMSGTKIAPDSRLYGCGGGKVMAFDLKDATSTVLADGLQTNDLVVTHRGHIYITETGKKQVTFLDPKTGEKRAADVGITAPNGIALTPDQTRLLVSDYGGLNVWSFAIQPDGSLTDKKPAMTMTAPEKNPQVAGGDGMTVDTAGRSYVTTALGLQIFGADGTLLGVLPKPQAGALTNAAFGGEKLNDLYVTCGSKLFHRKTQATGVLFFQPPLTVPQTK